MKNIFKKRLKPGEVEYLEPKPKYKALEDKAITHAQGSIGRIVAEDFTSFIERHKGLAICDSKHFIGPSKFHNETTRDLKEAYRSMLHAYLKEVMDEISRVDS